MLLSLLLAATPGLGVPPNADVGLACAVHHQFLERAQRSLAPSSPLLIRFEALAESRWRLTATDPAGRRVLTRELANACAEVAPLAVAIVERYLTSLSLPKAQLALTLKPRPKPAPSEPPPSTAPPPEPLAVTEPEPLSPEPPPEPVPPEPVAVPEPTPEPVPEPVPSLERPRVPLEVRRVEPTPMKVAITPAVGLGLWWETTGGLAPALVLEGRVEVGSVVHLALLGLTRWPSQSAIALPEGREGTLSVWSSTVLAAAGLCAGSQTRLCADAVIGPRLAVATSSGALYQRRDTVLALPTAGLRAHASIRLSRWFLVTVAVLATVPWGRSSVSIEGTSASYATPPVDLVSLLGLQLTP